MFDELVMSDHLHFHLINTQAVILESQMMYSQVGNEGCSK